MEEDFFILLPDQPQLDGGKSEGVKDKGFESLYLASSPLPGFYAVGELEERIGTDLIRIWGQFETEGIWTREMRLPDNTSTPVMIVGWYTRRGRFRGLAVDLKDAKSADWAFRHLTQRSERM